MKTLILLITLISLSAFAGEKNCKVDVIFPYGTEEINDQEVLSTFDGAIESLTTKYVNQEINKALSPLDIGVSGQGERSDFKIVVGFSGMLNKPGLSNEKLKSFAHQEIGPKTDEEIELARLEKRALVESKLNPTHGWDFFPVMRHIYEEGRLYEQVNKNKNQKFLIDFF